MPRNITATKVKHIVGISTRTTNEAERSPTTARIPALWQRFMREGLGATIPNKAANSSVYGVYTDYETDHTGPFTLVVGCEVTKLDAVPEGMVAVTIPATRFDMFPLEAADGRAIQSAWQTIWSHYETSAGRRAYAADYEEIPGDHDGQPPAIFISVR